MLHAEWEERLRTYISTIAKTNGHKMIAINNMHDHLHLFVGLNPNRSISEMMRIIKGDSSEWINKERLTARKFQWQEGYGAFSYAKSQVDTVAKYVMNQQEHHKKITFIDEYKQMLEKFEVAYDERYIFKMPADD
jgi:REP element-mobilizing transposase RayT